MDWVDTSCEQAEWKDQTCSTSSETKDDKAFTKQLGTSEVDMAHGVTTDSSGNIYVTGSTDGGLDENTNSGKNDIFLVKYNSMWFKTINSSNKNIPLNVNLINSCE